MVAPGRQAEPVDGAGQQASAAGVGRAPAVDLGTGQQRVGFALAGLLPVPGHGDPLADDGRGLARGRRLQFAGWQGRHFQHQVDAVEQRAGELVVVAGDLLGRAAAAPVGVSVVAAGAGVHGRHELEAGRKLGPPGRPRDGDVAALEGLAQGLEHALLELGQLVQEQHPVVGQADLAGARRAAAAHQGRRGRGVVRRAQRPEAPQLGPEAALHRQDGGALQRFVVAHRRQEAGQALGQHRLPSAGWAEEEDLITLYTQK